MKLTLLHPRQYSFPNYSSSSTFSLPAYDILSLFYRLHWFFCVFFFFFQFSFYPHKKIEYLWWSRWRFLRSNYPSVSSVDWTCLPNFGYSYQKRNWIYHLHRFLFSFSSVLFPFFLTSFLSLPSVFSSFLLFIL